MEQLFNLQRITRLDPSETLVYRYTVEHPNTVPYLRLQELADAAGVSAETVLHFCQKMDCSSYAEFKWKLKEQVGAPPMDVLQDPLPELQAFFQRVDTPAYQAKLEQAAALVAQAERVFTVGIGNSGSIASYGARYFSNMGKFAMSVTDPFYPITASASTTMAAVLLSVSGETGAILQIARNLKARNCSLIAITSRDDSSLARLADFTLPYYTPLCRQQMESCDFTTQIPAIYLLESISRRVYGRLLE